jgi:hypothetical protein
LSSLRVSGLVIGQDAFFIARPKQIAALALHHSVPTIYQFRDFAVAGGLMSYGGEFTDTYHQSGIYAGRDPQRREAPRSAGAAGHERAADRQPQDRQVARAHHPASASRVKLAKA